MLICHVALWPLLCVHFMSCNIYITYIIYTYYIRIIFQCFTWKTLLNLFYTATQSTFDILYYVFTFMTNWTMHITALPTQHQSEIWVNFSQTNSNYVVWFWFISPSCIFFTSRFAIISYTVLVCCTSIMLKYMSHYAFAHGS